MAFYLKADAFQKIIQVLGQIRFKTTKKQLFKTTSMTKFKQNIQDKQSKIYFCIENDFSHMVTLSCLVDVKGNK